MADHAEIWLQPPPAPIQKVETLVHQPAPVYEQEKLALQPPLAYGQEKVASDDLLMMGMMLWLEQGMIMEWLRPPQEKKADEEGDDEHRCGHHHD